MVFAGEFWPGATGYGLAEGFRGLGWAVQEIDYRYYGRTGGASNALRIASRLTRHAADEAYRQRIIYECESLKPDIFMTVKGLALDAAVLQAVKTTGARTIMFYPDFHFNHRGLRLSSFTEYDLFVTTKTFQVAHLQDLLGPSKVAYVPHGFVASVHRPILDPLSEADYSVDVLYVGSYSDYKKGWIDKITTNDRRCLIRGSGWENARSLVSSGFSIGGPATGIAYATAVQTARVNIAVHFGPGPSGWEDMVSTRTFEIPACRGFMLHIDNEEVRDFFRPGVEIDVFSSGEELDDKIGFYLRRPELRHKMIELAYRRALSSYNYGSRASAVEGHFRRPASDPRPL